MSNDNGVGVIQEQGDLGLGWNPVAEHEQQRLKEHEESNRDHNKDRNAFHS